MRCGNLFNRKMRFNLTTKNRVEKESGKKRVEIFLRKFLLESRDLLESEN